MKLIFCLSFCVFLFACIPTRIAKVEEPFSIKARFVSDLTQDFEYSKDSLRVSWIYEPGFIWQTLIYDMDDSGIILGANLIRYNKKLNSRDTMYVDSSTLLSESYDLLTKITNPSFKKLENEFWSIPNHGNYIKIAKKEYEKTTSTVIDIWSCYTGTFQECTELSRLLDKINYPYTNRFPSYLTNDLESSSDNLHMTWLVSIGRYWHTLIYDMDDSGTILGASITRYNEFRDITDTLRVDSTALASEVYDLISKIDIANLSPVTSNKILWEEGDASMVYFAKKGIDTVQHCDVKKISECAKLANLLYRLVEDAKETSRRDRYLPDL